MKIGPSFSGNIYITDDNNWQKGNNCVYYLLTKITANHRVISLFIWKAIQKFSDDEIITSYLSMSNMH